MALGATLEAALLPARDGTGFGIPRNANTEDAPAEEATDLTDLPPPSSASTFNFLAAETNFQAGQPVVLGIRNVRHEGEAMRQIAGLSFCGCQVTV